MNKKLSNKSIGSKVINSLLLKQAAEWLVKTVAVKPKYSNLVALENSHYILDSLQKCIVKYPSHDGYLDQGCFMFKQIFE